MNDKKYNPNNPYPPDDRNFIRPSKSDLISKAPGGSYTPLPNYIEDDIVCQNISNPEFEYIENLLEKENGNGEI